MSLLEELLNKYCPDGVEYKKLDEVVSILDNLRKPVSKNKRIKGNYPYYGANGIQDYIDNYIFDGTFILMGEDGSVINKDNSPVLNWAIGKIWVNNHAHVLYNENINTLRFLFYYLQTIDVSNIVRGIPPKINQQNLRNIEIPVPPIEVQKEIVRILDIFTEKTNQLQELLNRETILRKKQYEYYQNKLLFNTKFNKVKMSDICTVNQGLQIPISQRKKEDGKNRYFYITVQFLKGNNKDKYYIENPAENVICDTDDILVTRTGSTGKIITGVKGCFHNNFFKLNFFNNINKRYIYYVLNTKKMYEQMLNAASGGTVPDLPHKAFYKLEIYFPPLEEQKRIVKILDRFDTLCNDITRGLPAEIDMR
ncbi:restriction endonuclease subunit S, partial [Brachyspira innocens]|uniref:restriction endonuclease subunit S n=2 Tax=Brachyspira innocens TaxID=13264 RepID=UPI0004784DD8